MKHFWLIVVFLILFLSTLTSASLPRITAIEIDGVSPEIEAQIRQVINLQPGALFDKTRLDQAIETFHKWGRFTSIDVSPVQERGGVRLKMSFKEGYTVSGIDIYGGYPYLSIRLRRMIDVHSGNPYDPASAEAQRRKLAAFYERRGYAGTEVTLSVPANEKKKTVDLVYRIHKGKRYKIGGITVTGNRAFPHNYFVSQINPYLLYDPSRLRNRLDKIRRDYHEKGYFQARVRLARLEKDETKKIIRPVLEVTEGKKVDVIFQGNKRVSIGTFKKILPIFTDGGYSDYDIEASKHAIDKYYRQMGFLGADVSVTRKETGPDTLQVQFWIHEGPQTQVKSIAIDGNQEISDRSIKKDLVTKENIPFRKGLYHDRIVEEDFKNLSVILKHHGALEGEALEHQTVLNTFRDKADVRFLIREGEISKIREVRFQGNHHIRDKKLLRLLKLRSGVPFNPDLMQEDQKKLAAYYANHGFPYMTVSPHPSRQEGPEVSLLYEIHEGDPVSIGEILIMGNERTNRRAVLQALLLKRGDLFNYQKVVDSEISLRKTNAFRSVAVETIGLMEKRPVVHLLVKLEEYRKILLDFGGTFDTDDGPTGNLSISHVNLFGTAKNGILKLTGGRDLQKGEAILKDTHFFGYPLEGALSALVERRRRPGFTSLDGGGAISFLKDFSSRTSLLARYELTRTTFTDVTDTTGLSEEDHTTSLVSLSLNYDQRDSYADPRKGYVVYGGLDVSTKVFASAFNYIQPNAYLAYYLPLGDRFTLLNYIHFEWIDMIGVDNLTRDRRLFLGGDYTIRGFSEDSVGPVGADGRPAGGLVLLAQTTELQARLVKNFKLAAFVDNGSITNAFTGAGGIGAASFRHGAGLGIRYVTPIGPIRLDYGIKLDKQAGEPVGHLHLAFGYAF